MPKIAAMHQPHEIRFAMAMAPSTMTRMTATGVSQARMFVWSDVAPVMKGEVAPSEREIRLKANDCQNSAHEHRAQSSI